jgi:hypothetical protein
VIRFLPLCLAWFCSVAWFCSAAAAEVRWPRAAPRAVQPPGAAGPRVRVEFAPGRSAVALAGEVRGYEVIDYVLAASASERLSVALGGGSRYLVMAVYAPDGEAMCVETCGRQWTGVLSRAGDYAIRVGLVRAEARRQGRASYTLRIGLAR